MIARSERCQSWLEKVTHQMNNTVRFPISFVPLEEVQCLRLRV